MSTAEPAHLTSFYLRCNRSHQINNFNNQSSRRQKRNDATCRSKLEVKQSRNQVGKSLDHSRSLVIRFQAGVYAPRQYVNVIINGFSNRLQLGTLSDTAIFAHQLQSTSLSTTDLTPDTATSTCDGSVKHGEVPLQDDIWKTSAATALSICQIIQLNLVGLVWTVRLSLLTLLLRSICNHA